MSLSAGCTEIRLYGSLSVRGGVNRGVIGEGGADHGPISLAAGADHYAKHDPAGRHDAYRRSTGMAAADQLAASISTRHGVHYSISRQEDDPPSVSPLFRRFQDAGPAAQ